MVAKCLLFDRGRRARCGRSKIGVEEVLLAPIRDVWFRSRFLVVWVRLLGCCFWFCTWILAGFYCVSIYPFCNSNTVIISIPCNLSQKNLNNHKKRSS